MGTSGAASSHQAAGNKLFKEGFLDEAICAYDLALEAADDSAARTAILCNRSAALLKLARHREAALAADHALERAFRRGEDSILVRRAWLVRAGRPRALPGLDPWTSGLG